MFLSIYTQRDRKRIWTFWSHVLTCVAWSKGSDDLPCKTEKVVFGMDKKILFLATFWNSSLTYLCKQNKIPMGFLHGQLGLQEVKAAWSSTTIGSSLPPHPYVPAILGIPSSHGPSFFNSLSFAYAAWNPHDHPYSTWLTPLLGHLHFKRTSLGRLSLTPYPARNSFTSSVSVP